MHRCRKTLGTLFCLLGAGAAIAAPRITPGGVVNAASFKIPQVPGSGLAQGALATAFGSGLGPSAGVSAQSFPLGTTLAGVAVRITSGAMAVNALPVFVLDKQVNFIVPSNTPLGRAEVRVIYNGETSPPEELQIVATAFGLFTFTQGTQRAVVQNYVSATELPINLPNASARPGQTLIAYGTGLGAVGGPDNVPPAASNIANANLEVLVGGRPARVTYAGRSPCCSGLDQIVFEVPAAAPAGCTVPVAVRTGSTYSNVADVSITSQGEACSDAATGATEVCYDGSGGFLLIAELWSDYSPQFRTLLGWQQVSFARLNGCARLPLLPSAVGSCSVKTEISGASTPPGAPQPAPAEPPVTFTFLDAGPLLTLSGPNGQRSISRLPGTVYANYDVANPLTATPYLTSGSYTISGPGGRDVGAFQHTFPFAPLRGVAPAKDATIDLARPPVLTWTGGEHVKDYLQVGIVLIDQFQDTSLTVRSLTTSISCGVRGGAAGSFQIPEYIWAQVPDAHGRLTIGGVSSAFGVFGVSGGSLYEPKLFDVPGLRYGLGVNLLTSHAYFFKYRR